MKLVGLGHGLGLFDMSGSVWEWCQDVCVPGSVIGRGADRAAQRKGSGDRVIRGGSWNLDAWSTRCSRRFGFPEDYFSAGLGLSGQIRRIYRRSQN